MDDKTIREWRGRLDRQRESLADPFPGLWSRLEKRRNPWVPTGVAAAAALLVALGWGQLGSPAAENGWEPIVDELWAASGEASGRPVEAGWEIGGEEWNLFDPGDDQGV